MRNKNNGKDFCMFALPGMFCFFAVVIVPFIYGVYLTFTDWNGVAQVKNFVGFKNFGGVVKDGQFWTSLLLTFKYVIFVVIIEPDRRYRAWLYLAVCIFQSIREHRREYRVETF